MKLRNAALWTVAILLAVGVFSCTIKNEAVRLNFDEACRAKGGEVIQSRDLKTVCIKTDAIIKIQP